MKDAPDLNFLKTRPEDIDFHTSRIMFCIKDGALEVAPPNIQSSHIEWFKDEGWVEESSLHSFLEEHIRGFFLKQENRLYCYKGAGFAFNEKVRQEVLQILPQFMKMGIDEKTEVHLGPKDKNIQGTSYEQLYIGTIRELSKR